MVCMLVMSATTAASAYLVRPALDDVFINKDQTMLKIVPLALLIVYMLRATSMFGQVYLMFTIGQNIIRKLRNMLYERIQGLDLGFFQKEKTGVLMSRITYDVGIVQEMVSTAVTGSLRDCFTIIGLTVVIFYQIWELALLAFVVLPIAFYPIVYFGKRVRRTSTGCQETMADLNAFLHETLSGIKIIKAFSMEEAEKQRFFRKTSRLCRLEIKEAKYKSLSSPINQFLGGVAIAVIIWYGGSKVIEGIYTTGTFASFLAAVLLLYEPVKKLSKLNNAVQRGLAATDRIFEIIEKKPTIVESPRPATLPSGPKRISFQHVYFGYSEHMVLKDINLEVAAGEVVALVGMSGGGKTSLVNLIPRLYDVSRGAVSIDGTDIREYTTASLRSQIAIVTQEPILFNDTIVNNIAYGRPDAAPVEIEAAAKAAYAYDFIMSFGDGFETSIGELGGRLSGGEKQRICIARALLKDAPILILDEATSSLDSKSEKVVQKALKNLMKGRTTIVIAHRLSTIDHADRIVVISKGRIVEEGKHRELMALRGEYAKFYQMQFSPSQPVGPVHRMAAGV
jgi:subfamily B ATP-binding cassette protein MsbA